MPTALLAFHRDEARVTHSYHASIVLSSTTCQQLTILRGTCSGVVLESLPMASLLLTHVIDTHSWKRIAEGRPSILICFMACVLCDIVGECLYACRSKGYGFVSFGTLEAAENAIAAMHGKPIGYRHVPNCTIPF